MGNRSTNDSILNVIAIGRTGHGKSTLCNFLCDPFQQPEQKQFREADWSQTRDPCTQEVSWKEMTHNGYRIRLVDTPGLGEGTNSDLLHMIDLFKKLIELGSVCAVIICFNYTNNSDDAARETLRYYKQLLAPAFNENRVALFLTHVPDDHFREWVWKDQKALQIAKEQGLDEQTFSGLLDKIRKTCLDSISELTGFTFDFAELTNPAVPEFLADKFREAIQDHENSASMSIYSETWCVRERFLDKITDPAWSKRLIDITKHLFPLPPRVNEARIKSRDVYQAKSDELKATVRVEEEKRGFQVRERDRKYEDLTNAKALVKHTKEQLAKWKEPVHTKPPIQRSGDQILYFGRKKGLTTVVANEKNMKLLLHPIIANIIL